MQRVCQQKENVRTSTSPVNQSGCTSINVLRFFAGKEEPKTFQDALAMYLEQVG